MEIKNPLFTIIIPVKNRATYLEHTLRTCTMQEYDNLEIIVSDDGSSDNTKSVVEMAMKSDTRIQYYCHEKGIGMRENFEFALNKVKPGYVIALGGDDGILPNGISNMWRVLKQTQTKMLCWPAALYSFPNVYGPNGQLVIYHDKGVRIINSNDFLNRQSKNLYYLTDKESPMFYVKGVVSTELINKVKSRTVNGEFYSCPTPDGYSGIVLAGEVSSYAFSGEPFSIYGMSSSSQGLAYLSNEEKSKIESENFFKDALLKPMHADLASQPYSPLITLMTVDYLLTARDLPGWNGQFGEIEYKEVLAKSVNELSLGVYGESRVSRELLILKNIAIHHGLENYYIELVKKSKKFKEINLFDGNGISPSVLYLDAKAFDINNIYDAAYAAKTIYSLTSQVSLKSITGLFVNSLKYKLKTKRKGKPFPDISTWGK
jgi:glycosyltransferase involved in cell wall biosynthesis